MVIKSRTLMIRAHSQNQEGRRAFKILTEKRLLMQPRHVWEDNIGMGLKEIGVSIRNRLIQLMIVIVGGSL